MKNFSIIIPIYNESESIFDLIKLLLVNKNDNHIEHDHFLINEELNLNERI